MEEFHFQFLLLSSVWIAYEEKLGFSSAIAKTNPGAMFRATRQSSPDDFMLRECMVFDAHRSG